MNNEHLNKLVGQYLNNFSLINDENQEYYKWEAVKHFQDHWDIDAENFSEMFKEAVSKTSNLINNHIVQPANGIVKLAERPEVSEEIRSLFRELFYTEDSGNIEQRQDRIEHFSDAVNNLLDKYEPGKWKYRQDLRSVLFYLNLFAPDKNYHYKATQAREFMYCVEYGDDFGSGMDFRLSKYYRMCDWLVEQIKTMPDLIKAHTDRMTETMFAGDDFHILAFDIIYSGVVYNLYHGIDIYRPTKANSKERAEKARIEAAEKKLSETTNELEKLLADRSMYDGFSAVGLKIYQRSFGDGTISVQDGNYITVTFSVGDKRFLLPTSFTAGFLKTDDEEVMRVISEMSELDSKIEQVRSKIRELQRTLNHVG